MPRGVYIHEKGRNITWGSKISASLKGRIFSEESKRKSSESHKGYIMSEEQKEKIRKSMLGKNKGKIRTDSVKIKNSISHKGIHPSLDSRKKMSLRGKGRKMSEETKNKIRKSLTGRDRPELTGDKNPMFTHPNSYKSRYGKCGYRKDIGIFVRSRWEANVYRIYKYLGYTVYYEPKSFRLSNGKTYRPDFFIKELNLWIEVKGRWLKEAKEKFEMFISEYPEIEIQVIREKEYKELLKEFESKIKMEV